LVAPRLAQRFTVVAPDLRGYGASGKPPTDPEHLPYSKRATALDLVEVMTALGFDRFDIVGHDRGARVTYRLALDHPDRVRHAAVLDVVPTIEQFERMDRNGARAAYHWFFLAQLAPFPETLISKDADYFIEHSMQTWCGTPGAFTREAMASSVACVRSSPPGVESIHRSTTGGDSVLSKHHGCRGGHAFRVAIAYLSPYAAVDITARDPPYALMDFLFDLSRIRPVIVDSRSRVATIAAGATLLARLGSRRLSIVFGSPTA
jgi:pimeloyl-ACP methyl ester carboxylesterase